MLIDTHCHLNYPPLIDDIDAIIDRALSAGVSRIICVGTTVESSERAIQLSEKYDIISATAGIHPSYVGKTGKGWQREVERLCEHPNCIAVGEIGIDHYWDHAPGDIQKKFFHEQVEMSKAFDLPVIIHNREADDDVAEVLDIRQNYNGVLHCFSSDWNYAERMIAKGLLISFTALVTYGNKMIKEVVRNTPLDMFMVETDAPYLTPSVRQGQSNEPAWLPLIVEKIAKLKDVSVEEICEITSKTATDFFNIHP